MALTEAQKLKILVRDAGHVRVTCFENADMAIDSQTEELDALMWDASERYDDDYDSDQINAYRITTRYYNAAAALIAEKKSVVETLPTWMTDGNIEGYQAFSDLVNMTGAAGDYTFALSIDGVAGASDISVTCTLDEVFATLIPKIVAAVDLEFSGDTTASVAQDGDGRIRITSDLADDESFIDITAPSAGTSLITALTGVETSVPGTSVMGLFI